MFLLRHAAVPPLGLRIKCGSLSVESDGRRRRAQEMEDNAVFGNYYRPVTTKTKTDPRGFEPEEKGNGQ
jgi:hypothetical protein